MQNILDASNFCLQFEQHSKKHILIDFLELFTQFYLFELAICY